MFSCDVQRFSVCPFRNASVINPTKSCILPRNRGSRTEFAEAEPGDEGDGGLDGLLSGDLCGLRDAAGLMSIDDFGSGGFSCPPAGRR